MTLRKGMTMANARVKDYKVTYEDGGTALQPFTEAQAGEYGTVLEKDGVAIDAAVRMVDKWNTRAKLQGNKLRYSIPFVKPQG